MDYLQAKVEISKSALEDFNDKSEKEIQNIIKLVIETILEDSR